MKRRNLIRHLRLHGCIFVREGSDHTVVMNPATGGVTEVPRHREIKYGMMRRICRDLGIPLPAEK
jgi:predicted RNA binding protein YcfA (HicA-like mRNA interferase family)